MRFLTLLVATSTIVPFFTAQASDLKECQAKIASMLANVKAESAKGPAGMGESYLLSADKSCGVEYVADSAYLTVTRFGNDDSLRKFETIVMNETELTSGGRVRAQLDCQIDGDSVVYQTRLPIFSDGVRSPFQEKTLTVSMNGRQIWVNLEARLSVLRSKINCTLDF